MAGGLVVKATKRVWSEELRGHLRELEISEARKQSTRSGNLPMHHRLQNEEPLTHSTETDNVRAFPAREQSFVEGRHRPELAAALGTVLQAAERLRTVEARAQTAEQRLKEMELRAYSQTDSEDLADKVKTAETKTEATLSLVAAQKSRIKELTEHLAWAETMLLQSKSHIHVAYAFAMEQSLQSQATSS
jgi:hypothetical protein